MSETHVIQWLQQKSVKITRKKILTLQRKTNQENDTFGKIFKTSFEKSIKIARKKIYNKNMANLLEIANFEEKMKNSQERIENLQVKYWRT